MSRRARFVSSVVCLLLAAPSAHASGGDHDPDQEANPATPARAVTGKPVPFDRAWLTPFFTDSRTKHAVEQFRAEDWAGAEAGFEKERERTKHAKESGQRHGTERQAAGYLLGLALASQSKWAEAGDVFESLYTSYPILAPYHAYNAARCRLRRGDAAGALEWAAKVPDGSVPKAETDLVRIDALRALARWSDALAALETFLQQWPNGPRHAEALFKKAEAIEKTATPGDARKTNAEITAIYRRVWAEAPLAAWGDRAAERLDQIAAPLPAAEAAVVRARTAGEWVSRGMIIFDQNRNAESEAAFTSALAAPGLDADLECRARFHRAQSVWKQRQRTRAAPLFDEAEAACARAANRDLHAKALYQGARCYAAANNREAALAHYARVEAEHADHSYADDARLRSAELATDAGDDEGAAKLLAEVPTRYPKGDLLNEALWRLAFSAWRAGRDDEAMKWLDENLRLIPHEEIWYAEGRVQYWKGRVFEKQGKRTDARDWYERAVREYPLSVYALLSLTRLKTLDPAAQKKLVATLRKGLHEVPAWTFPPRALYGDSGFLRAVELARMGQGSDARRELAKLGLATSAEKHSTAAARGEEEDLVWITATLLDRGGVWSASHSLPRHALTTYKQEYPKGIGEAKWKLAYPRAFPALVAKNTKANQLPEALQLAIMREESAFSPRIESFANAIGLTQMLIKTAKRFANGANVTREFLQDPAKNLEVGSRFLGFLWKHFDEAAPLAIAGYNAGEGAVDRWLGERGDLAMDEFMETIPYDETRNYTKRVLASYFTYSWLYGKQPVPSVPLAARAKSGDKKKSEDGDAAKPSRSGHGRASHR
ncbi:MAG TPA: transglycosylase SLT domain-containing protein [Polyangia bacterium]|jgi:soluble lytic murein transglycosylase|nr:transglycosylase SLT domain-containing protein [Polyangia bacterium]